MLRLRQPSRCQVKVSPLDTRLHRMATLSELSRPPKLSSRFKLSSQSKQTSRGSHPGSPTHSRLPSSRAPLRGAWEESNVTWCVVRFPDQLPQEVRRGTCLPGICSRLSRWTSPGSSLSASLSRHPPSRHLRQIWQSHRHQSQRCQSGRIGGGCLSSRSCLLLLVSWSRPSRLAKPLKQQF